MLRPGERLIVTNVQPTMVLLAGQQIFAYKLRELAFVWIRRHQVSDHLTASRRAASHSFRATNPSTPGGEHAHTGNDMIQLMTVSGRLRRCRDVSDSDSGRYPLRNRSASCV